MVLPGLDDVTHRDSPKAGAVLLPLHTVARSRADFPSNAIPDIMAKQTETATTPTMEGTIASSHQEPVQAEAQSSGTDTGSGQSPAVGLNTISASTTSAHREVGDAPFLTTKTSSS